MKEEYQTVADFDEIFTMAEVINSNTFEGELIATPLVLGDYIRMYAERPVTSSWKIGGMITSYAQALNIYEQQIINSKLLYEFPEKLYEKYGVKYFIFEKGKIANSLKIKKKFNLLWESNNLSFCKIRENGF